VDTTLAAGINYVWNPPQKRPLTILQTIGYGCAFLDYNQDGDLDILLVGTQPALYQGDGAGHFQDVTQSTKIGQLKGHFLGCAVGDYDNDGFPDIFLSGYREARLLHNEGGKEFRDTTQEANIRPQPWGTSCAWVETTPGSGRLDLIIANYAEFDPKVRQLCQLRALDGSFVQTSCGPREYKPLPAAYYRNMGRGKFLESSKRSGFSSLFGRGLGVAAIDLEESGFPAIYIANDEQPADFLRHQKGKEPLFQNDAEVTGVAYDKNGNNHAGMGTDWGDFDNDGDFDLFVTTFHNEVKSLYQNDKNTFFTDIGETTGLGKPTQPYVSFGCRFLDFDNDSWLDLVITSGHVQDNIDKITAGLTYRQRSQLLQNTGSTGKPSFVDVSDQSGRDIARSVVGRGLATGDFDNDGRIDILIVDMEGRPLLLHNETKNAGSWIGFNLVGTKSNRNGYGARVTVLAGGKPLLRHCHADGSYLSSSDSRVHIGLGSALSTQIEVRWTSGTKERFNGLEVGKYHTLREGTGTPIGG
jgi:hypothetical protein